MPFTFHETKCMLDKFRSKIDTFTETLTHNLMDSFRTELNLKPSRLRLGLKDTFFTMGSCFANAIGLRLEDFKFKTQVNPFGIAYNPVSIHQQLGFALKKELPADGSYATDGELFFNYYFHSLFSSLNKDELSNQIKEVIHQSNSFLKETSCLILTYGTAWVYELKDKKEIVANCHKQPASLFEKRLLTQKEVEDSFESVYEIISKQNPSIQIILTVSPVRHIKDTLPLNAVSKSILRIACHSLAQQFKNVEYFPACEIMMDDLRDYRFYKQDRIHPTEEAEDYIWEKFGDAYFDETTLNFIETWIEIKSALAHKPFLPHSRKHQQFLNELLVRLEKLKPMIDTEQEIRDVQSQLIS